MVWQRTLWVLLTVMILNLSTGWAAKPPEPMATEAMRLEAQLQSLKIGHQTLLKELTAIRGLIQSDQNGQALKQLELLIKKRTESYQTQMKDLETQVAYAKRRMTRPRPPRVMQVGSTARPFELKSYTGETVKLTDYLGKIVVLEWVNFRCPYSRYHYTQAKTTMDLANKYKDKDVVWLAINSTPTADEKEYERFTKSIRGDGLPFPILDDRGGVVRERYSVSMTPHVYVIDKAGKIVYSGGVDNAIQGKTKDGKYIGYVDQALTDVLHGKVVGMSTTLVQGTRIPYQPQTTNHGSD